ncbi:YadA-like family protein [Burkholderia gladioli]|uniref:YadA-like family protein n=1 Tax=Burkholderia gladioli TaxID=28095 RepID=UPI00163F740E|nr:YadA-like family protein [Burkholderia gladioli]
MNDEFGTWRQAPGSLVCRRQADRAGRRGAGHGMQGWLASPRQRGVLGAAVAGFMLLGVEQARGASESDDTEQVCAETSPTAGKLSCRTNLTVRKYAPDLGGDHPILDSGRSTRVVPPEETIHPESRKKVGTLGKSTFLRGSNFKRVDARLDNGSTAGPADERDARTSPATLPTSSPRISREFDSLSSGFETLRANMSWLRSSLSTALVPVSRDIGSLSSSLSTASGVIASLSTSTSTRIGKLESGLDKMSSTAQFQTQQIDGVVEHIGTHHAQLGELNRQTALLEQADAEAKATAQAQAKQIVDVSKRTARADAQLGELHRQTTALEQADAEAKSTAQAQAKQIVDVSKRTARADAQLGELHRQTALLEQADAEAKSTAQAQAKQIDDVSKRTDRADAQLGELHRQTASLEQADAAAKSTAQAQAKKIDDVSKRIDRGDAQLGELNRQTAALEQADAEAKATVQAQAKQIVDVSKRIDRGEAQLGELNRQMAPLARASDEARRNDSFIAPTVSGGGSGPMVESSGPGADHTGRSRIDPAGCTLANGFDATATGLCAAAGTIAGRNGARESRRADGATAYGAYARAREHHATAVGFRALAARDGAVAIGYQAGALGGQAAALGDGARAEGDRSVALGASALAAGRGAVALGAGSIADRDATVSIGSPGRERRLVNLAPGVAPGDAVNLSQLATLGRSLEDVARRAYTGVAMSMAMSGLYLPSLNPGEVAVGVGVGGFSGYRAIALNLKGLAGNGRLGWGAGVSTTGRLTGFNLGAGWKW